jgi:hypothetical protein
MRPYRTDYALWGLISGVLFLLFGAALLLVRNWTPEARARWPADAVYVAVWSLVLGGVFQSIAVRCGVRLSRTADPGPADDYDDRLSPPPPPPTAG